MHPARGPADCLARLNLVVRRWAKRSGICWYASTPVKSVVIGPHRGQRRALDEELLLSDHLGSGNAMGDEQPSFERPRTSSKFFQRGPARSFELPVERKTTAVRERTAVEAELHPGKAVSPPRPRRNDRQPIPSRLARHASDRVLQMVTSIYPVGASGSQQEWEELDDPEDRDAVSHDQEVSEIAGAKEPVVPDAQKRVSVTVQSWHREEMRHMVCKALLFSCLVELRSLQRQPDNMRPMWPFERERAMSYVDCAKIVDLVGYLSKLHFQVKHGSARQKYIPGTPLDISIRRLQEILLRERRNLYSSFEAEMGGAVSEDKLIRHYLDGDISWAIVCQLLRSQRRFHS